MNRIRKIFFISQISYKEWLMDYRQIISFIVMILISHTVTEPLVEMSKSSGEAINILEPFIATLNSPILITITIFLFLLLISDFPLMEGNNGYVLIRTDKLSWLVGKLIFSIFAIITFLLLLFIIITVPAIINGYLANGWSYITKDFMEKYQDLAAQKDYFAVVTEHVFNHFKPYKALLHCILLISCLFFTSVLIMMIFNFLNKKIFGIILNSVLTILGLATIFSYKSYKFLFPPANSLISSHNTELHNLFPISFSYIYYGLIIIILLATNIVLCKKSAIQKDGER